MELPANQEACQSVSLAIRDIRLKQYILKRAAAAATPPPQQPAARFSLFVPIFLLIFHNSSLINPEVWAGRRVGGRVGWLVGYLGSSGHDIRVPENPFHSICIACAIASRQTGRRQTARWDKLSVWTVTKQFSLSTVKLQSEARLYWWHPMLHWDVFRVRQLQNKRSTCWILT